MPDNTDMAMADFDAVIIGAGLAGLAALREVDRFGCNVLCLEARDRIGGRILTLSEQFSPLPIELGAEFVHGRAPEIWDLIRDGHLIAYDCAEKPVHIRQGKVQAGSNAWQQIERVMSDVQKAADQGPDESFASFLAKSSYKEDTKQLSTAYVEGFNAARKEIVGIVSLAQDAKAADLIDGDHSFRLASGYNSIPLQLLAGVRNVASKLRLGSVVDRIEWRPGSVAIQIRDGEVVKARQAIVTVPLGVLQAEPGADGAIAFDPEPAEILNAARSLRCGQVYRVVLRFREAFWETDERFADAGFFLSDEALFPTWWTTLAVRAPILMGWSAGPHADALSGKSHSEIISCATASLARITSRNAHDLSRLVEAAYLHDWHADPFARCAYSYVPTGVLPVRKKLAQSVSDTLFFAGEATEQNGHSATVHGAIASGIRAAREMLEGAPIVR